MFGLFDSKDEKLRKAAEKGNLKKVRELLKQGADPNYVPHPTCSQPLSLALTNNHYDVAIELIDAGADVNDGADVGFSYISYLAINGDSTIDVIKSLVEHGADIELKDQIVPEFFETTPLYQAAYWGQPRTFHHLIEVGASLDIQSEEKNNLMYAAAFGGNTEIISTIHKAGKDLNSVQNEGLYPIHVAAERGHDEAIDCLVNFGVPVNQLSTDGRTPLYAAAMAGRESSVKKLLQLGADPTLGFDGKKLSAVVRKKGHPSIAKLVEKEEKNAASAKAKAKKAVAVKSKAAPKTRKPASPPAEENLLDVMSENLKLALDCIIFINTVSGDRGYFSSVAENPDIGERFLLVTGTTALAIEAAHVRDSHPPNRFDATLEGLVKSIAVLKNLNQFLEVCAQSYNERVGEGHRKRVGDASDLIDVIHIYADEITDVSLQKVTAFLSYMFVFAGEDQFDEKIFCTSVLLERWRLKEEDLFLWATKELLPLLTGEKAKPALIKELTQLKKSEAGYDGLSEGERFNLIEKIFEEFRAVGSFDVDDGSCVNFDFVGAGNNSFDAVDDIDEEIELDKQIELMGENRDILDQHYAFMEEIAEHYKKREDPKELELAIQACKKQIDFGEKALKAFAAMGMPVPEHHGYKQLSIIYEKQGKYSAAIDVCRAAMKQGWAGDWAKRIDRYGKKL